MTWLPGRDPTRRSSKAALRASSSREHSYAPKVARDPVVPGLVCPKCTGKIVVKKRHSDGRPFLSCSRFPICKFSKAVPKKIIPP